MRLILIDAGQDGYHLIEVPARIAARAGQYQADFDRWLTAPDSGHSYRCLDPEGNSALCYDGAQAFVDWLNGFVLREDEERARVVPRLFF